MVMNQEIYPKIEEEEILMLADLPLTITQKMMMMMRVPLHQT